MKALILLAVLAQATGDFSKNGTGVTWGVGATSASNSLIFAAGGMPAMIWSSCGCAEIYLGTNHVYLPCQKHIESVRKISEPRKSCEHCMVAYACGTVFNLPQGIAYLPCKEREDELRKVIHGG